MGNKSHPTFDNGKIGYIEIPAIDIGASLAFYKNVFGWQIRRRDDGSVSFDDAVGEVSGMWVTGRKPANEIGYVISIMVDSVLTTIDLFVPNGGKICRLTWTDRKSWHGSATLPGIYLGCINIVNSFKRNESQDWNDTISNGRQRREYHEVIPRRWIGKKANANFSPECIVCLEQEQCF